MATIDPLEHGGLVGSVIGRLRRLIADGYTFEDANQAGWIGLLRATRTWDESKGKFSTHACQAIEWAIQQDVARFRGVNYRSATQQRTEYATPLSLDVMIDEDRSFVDTICEDAPDDHSRVDAAAAVVLENLSAKQVAILTEHAEVVSERYGAKPESIRNYRYKLERKLRGVYADADPWSLVAPLDPSPHPSTETHIESLATQHRRSA